MKQILRQIQPVKGKTEVSWLTTWLQPTITYTYFSDNRVIDSVYQNYTIMNTHEHWWHMFCTNVSTKVEVVNLENDETKSVLVMLVASYFLNIR